MTTRKRTTRPPATKPTVEAVTEVAEITEKVTVETPAVVKTLAEAVAGENIEVPTGK